jgi:hypothetical protein
MFKAAPDHPTTEAISSGALRGLKRRNKEGADQGISLSLSPLRVELQRAVLDAACVTRSRMSASDAPTRSKLDTG